MNTKSHGLLLVAVWLGLLPILCAAEGTTDEEAKKLLNECEIYPLKIGTTWEYEMGEVPVTLKVVSHEKVGDQMCAKVVSFVNGQPVNNECVSVRADGVYRHAVQGFDAKPPIKILPLPLKAGAEWKIDAAVMEQKITGTYKLSEEQGVKVAAGTYDVFAVVSDDTEMAGNSIKQKTYYAKGVGLVKQRLDMGAQVIELQLKKFIPADEATGNKVPEVKPVLPQPPDVVPDAQKK